MPDFFWAHGAMGPIDSSIVWMMQNFECANHISGQVNQPIWGLTLDHMTQGCQINSRYKRFTVQEPQLRMKVHCIKQVPLFLINYITHQMPCFHWGWSHIFGTIKLGWDPSPNFKRTWPNMENPLWWQWHGFSHSNILKPLFLGNFPCDLVEVLKWRYPRIIQN